MTAVVIWWAIWAALAALVMLIWCTLHVSAWSDHQAKMGSAADPAADAHEQHVHIHHDASPAEVAAERERARDERESNLGRAFWFTEDEMARMRLRAAQDAAETRKGKS